MYFCVEEYTWETDGHWFRVQGLDVGFLSVFDQRTEKLVPLEVRKYCAS